MAQKKHKYHVEGGSSKTVRVGQAAFDLLSKQDDYVQQVGETIEMMTPKYLEGLRNCCENASSDFKSPFYIVVLGKKEPYALNVLRHWYIARQSKPSSQTLAVDYPNHFQDVFEYNKDTGDCKLLWSLTASWNHKEILKHRDTYHPDLVQWHVDHYEGKLA